MKRLLLLGGGHAHLQVLEALALAPLPGTEVTLLSTSAQTLYSGMVPGYVAGHYTLDDCRIPLGPLAQRAGVRFVEGMVTGIDAAARQARTREGSLPYELLSVDIGAVMDRDLIPGARAHGLFVRPIEAFAALWPQLLTLADERALGVVVIGGGAAGVELAMAAQHALGLRARVSLVTGGPPPLPTHPPMAQRLARRALKRHAITVFEDSCVEISADHVLLGRGMRLQCDAPVLAIGASAPPWLAGSGLALDAAGFIATGATLQSLSHPEVFAAGDVASRCDVQRPRSGVYAVRAGLALAENLRRCAGGGPLLPHVPQRLALNLLACGGRRAIASWGPLAVEGGWVWRWKDRIDRGFVARWITRAA